MLLSYCLSSLSLTTTKITTLHELDLPEEDIRVLNKIIPDLLFDLRSADEAFQDMKQMGLSGASPLGEVKTKGPNSDYNNHRDMPPVAARQAEVARDYLKRAANEDRRKSAHCGMLGRRSTHCGAFLVDAPSHFSQKFNKTSGFAGLFLC